MLRNFAALAALLGGVAALAQDPATLTVTIFDPSAAVVTGAKISLTDLHHGTVTVRETGTHGFAVFEMLPPGDYSLLAEKVGFQPYKVSSLPLHVRDRQTYRLELKPAAPSVAMEVRGLAQPVSNDYAEDVILEQNYAQHLPLSGRNAESLVLMEPGLVPAADGSGGFDANGMRPSSNYITLDGVPFNQTPAFANTIFGGGSTGIRSFEQFGGFDAGNADSIMGANASTTLMNSDAMEEMRIQNPTLATEFGYSTGAQIVLTSRRGSNDLHGVVYDYIRAGKFDASDWFANAAGAGKGSEHQERPGGVFGGPLTKNKTFFVIQIEKLNLTSPEPLFAVVPDLAARSSVTTRLNQYLNAFPLPNGPELGNDAALYQGSTSNPSDSSDGSIRVDHVFSANTNLFGRYALNNSNAQQRGSQFLTPNVLSNDSTRSQFGTVGFSHVFHNGAVNDLRVNYSDASAHGAATMDSYGGAVPLSSQIFPTGVTPLTGDFSMNVFGFAGYMLGGHFNDRQQQITAVDNLSKVYGRQIVKMGVEFRQLLQTTYRNPYSETVFFNGVNPASPYALLTGDALNTEVSSSSSEVYPSYKGFSLYGLDTIRATERTTITLGGRWDVDPAPTAWKGPQPFAISNDQIGLVTQNQPIYPTKWLNISPRAGISYLSDDAPGREMTLRAGFGLFFDMSTGVVGQTFFGAPYANIRIASEVGFPLAPGDLAPPLLPGTRPYGLVFTGDPGLLSPRVYEWNASWEKNFGVGQTVSLSLVGSRGSNLLVSTSSPAYNSAYDILQQVTNNAISRYNAVEVQFRKRLSRSLQAQMSYTWSHSIDTASTDGIFGGAFATLAGNEQGNSDFDIRHTVSLSGSWRLPSPEHGNISAPFRDWYLDFNAYAHTGLPFNLSAVTDSISAATSCNSNSNGGTANGLFGNVRPSYVGGAIWIDDPSAPGGRRLSDTAFILTCDYAQGNMGRNELRGFSFVNLDMAIRRDIPFGDRYRISISLEGFNVLNHPNFANPSPYESANLASPNFGVATQMVNQTFGGGVNPFYRYGGPRSMELALRFQF